MNFQMDLKKATNKLSTPPVGGYIAVIKNARIVEANERQRYHKLELMIDIAEGEYKDRFMQIFEDQKERGYDAKFKGVYRLSLPTDGQDNEKVSSWLSNQLFCVFDSNSAPGETKEYRWDGSEKSLIGKKVGVNIRKRLYNFTNDKGETLDGETTEIGKLETVEDVKAGRIRPMKDNDRRQNKSSDSTDGSNFTDVSKAVDVPW